MKCEIYNGTIARHKAFFEFVATNKDGDVIGSADASLLRTDKKFMWIDELHVEPKCRDKGVGSEIVQAVADEAKQQKAELVYVYPATPATEEKPISQKKIEHFYKKNGFVPCNPPEDVATVTSEGLRKRGLCLIL